MILNTKETVIQDKEQKGKASRAVLVSVMLPGTGEEEAIVSLAELKRLLETAGGEFFAKLLQSKRTPDPATYLGSGKALELRQLCRQNDVDLVVFDCELSPSQIRNVEKLLNEKDEDAKKTAKAFEEAPEAFADAEEDESSTDEGETDETDTETSAEEAKAEENSEGISTSKRPSRRTVEEKSIRVLDRSMLILDIFALHAVTGEGKLQVELAQLKYTIPRLTGRGAELSRLGGGIGTRGPGESKLESDRRHVRRRIAALTAELRTMEKNRLTMRARRDRTNTVKIAIAGYTNAGKSTLLNRLTDAGILAEDKLFATLDPTTRRLTLPGGTEVMLTDTVGFIRNLPHHLVEAFKSTLEEVATADIILIVSDASDPECSAQLAVTEQLIADIMEKADPAIKGEKKESSDTDGIARIGGKAVLYGYNKCDCEAPGVPTLKDVEPQNRLFFSAKTGEGVDELLARLEELALSGSRRVTFRIPLSKQGAVSTLYAKATVESVDYGTDCVTVVAIADEKICGQLREFVE